MFAKIHEKTSYLCNKYVGMSIFLCCATSRKIVLVFSLILDGFIFSEKNSRGLGCVLKKRYVGHICGT